MQTLTFIFIALAAFMFSTPGIGAESESRGAYLARVGDCTSCHTAPGHALFAGGFQVHSPFGNIYGTNITPDKEFGIGSYDVHDFGRAVRQGIAKDGHHLYPAMPYPSFAGVSDEDIRDLYTYFMKDVQPVHERPPETKLAFPFNQRWGLFFWNLLFADKKFLSQPDKNAQWNQGAYLVETLGHCGACHTPRGIFFQEKSQSNSPVFLSGETLDHWHAPDLRGYTVTGLGAWTEDDIVAFLHTGHGAGVAAFGAMTQVVDNSTQYMNDEDRKAIAVYLKSLTPSSDQETPKSEMPSTIFERPGAGLYASACSSCHQPKGSGEAQHTPKLAGNPAILSDDPTSVIRIILQGGISADTQESIKPAKMPAFGSRLTDEEIADVATFIRRSWGNHASGVTPRQVMVLRKAVTPP